MDVRHGVGKRLLIGAGIAVIAVAAGLGGAPMRPAAPGHAAAAQANVQRASAGAARPTSPAAGPVLVIAPLHAQGIVRTTAAGAASMLHRPATIHISFPREQRPQSFEISRTPTPDTRIFCGDCPGNIAQFAF